jgi:hypothetical protein
MEAYTVAEFCKKYRLGRTKFYALGEKGEGPLKVKVGASTRIPVEAAEAWWKGLQDKARAEQQTRAARAAEQVAA